mmetsp:Transcript_34526/g.87263  ORF Transcript_34526/g.87263 Transcript_34526/m.87263 type:complete len:178 (-) Transcript_34526:566-1099(-)
MLLKQSLGSSAPCRRSSVQTAPRDVALSAQRGRKKSGTTPEPARAGTPKARRGAAPVVEEDPARVVEEVASPGLFNDAFKAVLQESLKRQGAKALYDGVDKGQDDAISGQEEVLRTAIMHSKNSLQKLTQIRNETERLIDLETRQLERLQFALQKARNDAAYYRSVQAMMNDGSGSE